MEDIYFDGIKVFNCISLEKSNEISEFFTNNDYVLINNILTDEIKNYLKEHILFDKQNYLTDPRQFFREHHNEECSIFINRFYSVIKPFYEFILKIDLNYFIGFAMKYNENSDCKPHYDNYNMPISSTICFYNEDKISYPLYIDNSYLNNPHPFRLTIDDKIGIPEENKVKIDINEGDIGIFRGRNHLHWREKMYVKDYRALLCHTEDYKYNNKLVSYIFNNELKADINNVKNINIFNLTDLNNYENFRKDYVMYFK